MVAMMLQEALSAVLKLQLACSSTNTFEMRQRGVLIRNVIPDILKGSVGSLSHSANIDEKDLIVEGRDGTGRKSDVPWVRLASRNLSPSATVGWYVVLLFRRDGEGLYLALAHGSSVYNGMAYVPRSREELRLLVDWARSIILNDFEDDINLDQHISLGSRTRLALAYEKSCPVALYYPKHLVPDAPQLVADIDRFAWFLGKIYRAELSTQMSLAVSPDISDIQQLTTGIAQPGTKDFFSQGFGLTALERKEIELRAMEMAVKHLRARGYLVEDVSAVESFDLLARKGNEELIIEVKGTTGDLDSIVLTANEVELHQKCSPRNALILVHSIELVREGGEIAAQGGILKMWQPWIIDKTRLRSIAYSYSLAKDEKPTGP